MAKKKSDNLVINTPAPNDQPDIEEIVKANDGASDVHEFIEEPQPEEDGIATTGADRPIVEPVIATPPCILCNHKGCPVCRGEIPVQRYVIP